MYIQDRGTHCQYHDLVPNNSNMALQHYRRINYIKISHLLLKIDSHRKSYNSEDQLNMIKRRNTIKK